MAKSLEVTEDELLIIESWREVARGGFGRIEAVCHRGRLVGRERHHKDDVPQRVREVGDGRR